MPQYSLCAVGFRQVSLGVWGGRSDGRGGHRQGVDGVRKRREEGMGLGRDRHRVPSWCICPGRHKSVSGTLSGSTPPGGPQVCDRRCPQPPSPVAERTLFRLLRAHGGSGRSHPFPVFLRSFSGPQTQLSKHFVQKVSSKGLDYLKRFHCFSLDTVHPADIL